MCFWIGFRFAWSHHRHLINRPSTPLKTLAQQRLLYGGCQWVQIIALNLNFPLKFIRVISSCWIKHEKESKKIRRILGLRFLTPINSHPLEAFNGFTDAHGQCNQIPTAFGNVLSVYLEKFRIFCGKKWLLGKYSLSWMAKYSTNHLVTKQINLNLSQMYTGLI